MARSCSVVVSSPRCWSGSRRLAAWIAGLLLAAGVVVAIADAWRVSQRFPIARFRQPSRLYGRILELTPGASCRLADLAGQLARQGYESELADAAGATGPRAAAGEAAPRPGTYRLRGERLSVGLRRFPTPAGWDGGRPLVVEVRAGQIAQLPRRPATTFELSCAWSARNLRRGPSQAQGGDP
jgi:hypothetical protein